MGTSLPKQNGGGLRGDEQLAGHGWRARYQPSRHARSGMPSGYPASPRSFVVPNPVRACWAQGSDRRGGQVGESRSLVNEWIHGCSLTTSRLQRLARGILCLVGPLRFGGAGTRCTSASRHPITVTGGRLGRVARVLALYGRGQLRLRPADIPAVRLGSTQSKTSRVERSRALTGKRWIGPG